MVLPPAAALLFLLRDKLTSQVGAGGEFFLPNDDCRT
jgi:hypothetical protein